MLTSDFCCVVCSQYFSKNTELKNHIKGHNQLACLECKIDFNNYEYLLVHKLTFCHTPCLLRSCLYCKETAAECNCGKMHLALQKSLKLWMNSEKETGILQNGLYSMIFQYKIQENDRFDLVKLPYENEDENWSQMVIDTVVESILPKIVLESDAVQIDNCRISFHKIKEVLKDYFLDFEQFEDFILDFAIPIKEICGERSCTDHFSKTHVVENHPVCAFAKSLKTNEVPIRYTTKRELYMHLITHKILIKLPMRCRICNFRFKMLNNHLLIADVCNHAKKHGKEEKMICAFNTKLACQVPRPIGSLEEILHNFMFHCTDIDVLQVFQNILTHDEECAKSPARKSSISFGDLSKQEVENGQNGSDHNNTNFRLQSEENKFCSSFISEDKAQFACKNEKHTTPIYFPNELQLQLHIFEFHKCPACKFSTMMDKDLLIKSIKREFTLNARHAKLSL